MSLKKFFLDENYQFSFLLKIRNFCIRNKIKFFLGIIRFLMYRMGNCIISTNARIGHVKFAHPVGVVIGDGAIVGDGVVIFQNVTIGGKGGNNKVESNKYPVIEDNVVIYAGAKIIGGITIGKGSVIGANAVVLSDVPPKSLVV